MDDFGTDPHPRRNLTDADIDALAAKLEDRLARRFYLNLGEGVWSMVWKVILTGAVILAAYGATKGVR